MIARHKEKKIRSKLPKFDPDPSGKFAYKILSAANVSGVLIGRLAVWSWLPDISKHVFTKDLDIAIRRDSLPSVVKELNKTNAKVTNLSIGGVNASIEDTAINVDFIDRSDKSWGDLSSLFEDAIDEAIQEERFILVGEHELPLVSSEFLTTMKVATGNSKDEQDAENLIQYAELDVAKTRELILKYLGSAGIGKFEEILYKMGHPMSRMQKYKTS